MKIIDNWIPSEIFGRARSRATKPFCVIDLWTTSAGNDGFVYLDVNLTEELDTCAAVARHGSCERTFAKISLGFDKISKFSG